MRLLQKTMVAVAAVALTAGPARAQAPPPAKPTPPGPGAAAPAGQKPADQTPSPTPPAPPPGAAPRPFPEGAKVAYVDLQYIASNSVEGKAATAKIQEYAKKKTAELEG